MSIDQRRCPICGNYLRSEDGLCPKCDRYLLSEKASHELHQNVAGLREYIEKASEGDDRALQLIYDKINKIAPDKFFRVRRGRAKDSKRSILAASTIFTYENNGKAPDEKELFAKSGNKHYVTYRNTRYKLIEQGLLGNDNKPTSKGLFALYVECLGEDLCPDC